METICIKGSITANKYPQNSVTRSHLIDAVIKGRYSKSTLLVESDLYWSVTIANITLMIHGN